jgi:hypothetical protein
LSRTEGGKIVIAGARPEFPVDVAPSMHGFFEEISWDSSRSALTLKGWAPCDVRDDAVRFVLRDPFDRLRLDGLPEFIAQERPDVLQEHPHLPGARYSGFRATLDVTNAPRRSNWPDALELYCLGAGGEFYRLHRADAPARQSWDRRRDRFEIVLTYAAPEFAADAEANGTLDVCEFVSDRSFRLMGWAPFDGESPGSVLIVQLPPSAAPASIVSCVWFPRPDVRAAVAPSRVELERSGFNLVLQVRNAVSDVARPERLSLWAIDAEQRPYSLALTALEKE